MRGLRCVCLILLVLLAATAAQAGNAKLMKEVEAIGDKLAAAMLADDVETMLAMYTEDAISLPNFSPRLQGIEAFRKHHAEMAAAGMKVRAFSSDPTDVWSCGSQVIEIGTYEISLDMPGAPTIHDKGKYLTVYARGKDGKLKIKAETWNTDTDPMKMMAPPGEAHGHGHDHGHDHEH